MSEIELPGDLIARLTEAEQAKEQAIDMLRAERAARDEEGKKASAMLLAQQETLVIRSEDLKVAHDTIRLMTRERAQDLRSLRFLRNVLEALSDEFGLAPEDTAGIVRAAKGREGSHHRAQLLEAAMKEQKERHERIVASATQGAEIIARIAKLTDAQLGETVEQAVARVVDKARAFDEDRAAVDGAAYDDAAGQPR